MNLPPLSREQVREVDRRAIEEYGVPGVVLMENAGRGGAELLLTLNPERRPVAVCCGKGNNGGDGFVIARHLDLAGVPVRVLLFADPAALTGDARINHRIVERSHIPLSVHASDIPPIPADGWVVDALFGTGLAGPLNPPFDRVIDAINASGCPILAIDIPSGLDCDTGEPLGVTVRAAHTVTFVSPKKGFANPAAAPFLGRVHVADVGAPRKLLEAFATLR